MLTMLVPSGSLVGAAGSPTGLPTSFPEAVDAYEEASRDGDGAANAGMGTLELFGWGLDQDYRKALDYFRAAADRGHPRGKSGLGVLYANGYAVAPDYPRAFSLLTEGSVAVRGSTVSSMARSAGCARGACGVQVEGGNWARQPRRGTHARDKWEACRARGDSAPNGTQKDPLADYELGRLFLLARGRGVGGVDFRSTVKHWEDAAAGGYAEAQYHLGMLYLEGTPVHPQDLPRALALFHLADDQVQGL
jgi:TPR repeat protein